MTSLRSILPAAGLALLLAPAPAAQAADPRPSVAICAGACFKPISIADRWDDVTVLPGHEAWANNGVHDREGFTDASDNGLYDVGDPFVDENANGQFDQEAYHPALTGYVPDPVPGNFLAPDGDLGRLLRLRPDPGDRARRDTYAALVLPAIGHGEPERGARAYLDALAGCRPAVGIGDRFEVQSGALDRQSAEAFATMVAGDPDARWDPVTQTVVGLNEPDRSSRIVLVGLHDPRIRRDGGRGTIAFVKVVALFIEEPGADGTLAGRFLKLDCR